MPQAALRPKRRTTVHAFTPRLPSASAPCGADVDRVLALYAPNVVTFDVVAPLVNRGVAAVRKRLVEGFDSFETAIDDDVRDVDLVVSGDVAFEPH